MATAKASAGNTIPPKSAIIEVHVALHLKTGAGIGGGIANSTIATS